ncbi:MAG TPA: acetyl-CoA hydrolase/transferase C-terminal domain-containing protein [Dehalococcoidia bacterium]|nr:acetyl-CoA hydrolase/transferase C-terminal domain-containing protein [Dehalococcoidia bacterium]
MTSLSDAYKRRLASADDAAKLIRSGETIFVNGGAGFPVGFVQALIRRAGELENVRIISPLRYLPPDFGTDYYAPELAGHFFVIAEFTQDAAAREAVRQNRAAYRPHHLHEMVTSYPERLDWFVADVSRADRHGYLSFGTGTCYSDMRTLADRLILEVNEQQPRTFGNCFVRADEATALFEHDHPLPEVPSSDPRPVEREIAAHLAPSIEDGSTLQVGIGGVPDAVAGLLMDRRDLGIHSGMITDVIVDLYRAGAITGRRKTLHPGRIVSALFLGTRKLYDFIDDNPGVEAHPASYTNDPYVVRQNVRQRSINAVIEIDLLGQCAAETIGPLHYSGTGGAVDHVRGAFLAPEGKSFICLPSTTRGGQKSTIVPTLQPGTVVTTARNDVHYVATENGLALLKGRTVPERARALIDLAHPEFRPLLEQAARELRLLPG